MMQLVDLNYKGATAMTKVCLPYVPGCGIIVMVSSTSAFGPNTGMAVYSATKSYLSAFSTGLREELRSRHIHACTVNPGMVMTEMNRNARADYLRLPKVDVARGAVRSLRAERRGRTAYTTGWFYKCYRFVCKLLPQSLMVCVPGLEKD